MSLVYVSGVRSKSGGCSTTGNKPCIIPFIYNNIRYNGCTLANADDGKPWCSTKVSVNGHHIPGKEHYGHCNDDCPNDMQDEPTLDVRG